MYKKHLVLLITVAFAVFAISATFNNRSYTGADFPYIGALFCHDGDYVEFWCMEGYNYFYYMVRQNKKAYIELAVDGKLQGTVLELPVTMGNQSFVYEVGEHFSYANWGKFTLLGSTYVGHKIRIVFRENRTINKIYCPENDIMIKLPPEAKEWNLVYKWSGVDSREWCDLDEVAK